MDFRQVEDQFKQLKVRYQIGEITEADFKARLRDLMVQDAQGDWWMIGIETGKWYRNDGTDWVQADPPGYARPVEPTPKKPEPKPTAPASGIPPRTSPPRRQEAQAPEKKPQSRKGVILKLALTGIILVISTTIIIPGIFGSGDSGFMVSILLLLAALYIVARIMAGAPASKPPQDRGRY